jgi:hypothetical protein
MAETGQNTHGYFSKAWRPSGWEIWEKTMGISMFSIPVRNSTNLQQPFEDYQMAMRTLEVISFWSGMRPGEFLLQ